MSTPEEAYKDLSKALAKQGATGAKSAFDLGWIGGQMPEMWAWGDAVATEALKEIPHTPKGWHWLVRTFVITITATGLGVAEAIKRILVPTETEAPSTESPEPSPEEPG